MAFRMPKTSGDCEGCGSTSVQLYTQATVRGDMLICRNCLDEEIAVDERRKEVKNIIQESRQLDAAVILKTDIFLAKTPAAVELEAAIMADDTIPADQKTYALAAESMKRFRQFKSAVFSMRQELTERENEMRMWQVNTQRVAGQLHEKYRAEFAEVSVNYKPTPNVKQVKTTKPVKSGKSFDRAELAEACKKYDMTHMQSQIRMHMVQRNVSAEVAAKFYADKAKKYETVEQ